ncbi:MAG: porin, partial [Bacteroidales bacterium]|nr:porin [Bacteroidales bacterium]
MNALWYPFAEATMISSILMSLLLVHGQTETPPSEPASESSTPASSDDQWAFMRSLHGSYLGQFLDERQITISGWSELNFTASTDRYDQLPMGFNYRANEFLMPQNWLRVERLVDPNAAYPTFGFRSDTILPGSDYRFTLARGLFDGQLTANNGEPNNYGIDPIQFYTDAYFPQIGRGLDVKLGRFFSQIGVESSDATQNALVSRSYTFFYNPFTHTGVLTTLQLTADWSMQNGLVTGSDVFIDPASSPTYIGNIKWAPPGGSSSVVFSTIFGSGRYNQAQSFNNLRVFDLVYTRNLTHRLQYILDALYGFQSNVPGIGTATSLGAVNYLPYQ